jgi:hypothetical protein
LLAVSIHHLLKLALQLHCSGVALSACLSVTACTFLSISPHQHHPTSKGETPKWPH